MGKRPSPASTAQKCAAASSSSSPPPLLLRCHQSVNAPFPSSSLLFPSVFSPQKKTRKKQLFLYSTLLLLLGGRCQHRGRAQKHGISQFCSDSLATHVSSREKSFNFFTCPNIFLAVDIVVSAFFSRPTSNGSCRICPGMDMARHAF